MFLSVKRKKSVYVVKYTTLSANKGVKTDLRLMFIPNSFQENVTIYLHFVTPGWLMQSKSVLKEDIVANDGLATLGTRPPTDMILT